MLDSFSTDRVSIEVYKIQFFRADFTPICKLMFGLSFLTILNIYKDCFKGCHNWCNSMQKFFINILWTGDICLNSSFSSRNWCVCTLYDFVTNKLHDLYHVDELKNFAANIFLKLVSKPRTRIRTSNWLVTYWELCIKMRDCHYRTSPIGHWGKGSIVDSYKVLRFLYL